MEKYVNRIEIRRTQTADAKYKSEAQNPLELITVTEITVLGLPPKNGMYETPLGDVSVDTNGVSSYNKSPRLVLDGEMVGEKTSIPLERGEGKVVINEGVEVTVYLAQMAEAQKIHARARRYKEKRRKQKGEDAQRDIRVYK